MPDLIRHPEPTEIIELFGHWYLFLKGRHARDMLCRIVCKAIEIRLPAGVFHRYEESHHRQRSGNDLGSQGNPARLRHCVAL